MSEFLKKLKNAVESGEFNSEAAKKITEINELAEKMISGSSIQDLESSISKRIEDSGIKKIEEKDVKITNSEYEEKMLKLKTIDTENLHIKDLIEMEDLIRLSIDDMFSHLKLLETTYDGKEDQHVNLFNKINYLRSKYSIVIINH